MIAADAFDQQQILPLLDRAPAEGDDIVDVDAASLALRREIGRERQRETATAKCVRSPPP